VGLLKGIPAWLRGEEGRGEERRGEERRNSVEKNETKFTTKR